MQINLSTKVKTVKRALFPLPLVLFPGGKLPLQIFEQRYLDMIRSSMRKNEGFIITLSRDEGFADVGCEVLIKDFDTLPNGFLGILVVGNQKMRLSNPRQQKNGLWEAEAEPLPLDGKSPIPKNASILQSLFNSLRKHPAISELYPEVDETDAVSVSSRLVELLPFDLESKQMFLEQKSLERKLRDLVTQISAMEFSQKRDC